MAMIERLLGFVLILTRLSGFFLVLPVFSWQAVPMRVRVATAMLMSAFFAMFTPVAVMNRVPETVEVIILLGQEATYGLALGIIAQILFSVVRCAARIIEQEMGMTMAEVMDPLTGERTQPLGGILEMIFILLFLSANGHHLFLQALARSYETFPIGTSPSIQVLTGGIVEAGTIMLTASLRLAAPIMAAFLVMLVVLAILARIVPEMNILFLSMPVRVGMGLLLTVMFLPFLLEFVSEFSGWMGKLLPL
jgi:flagellar biosynthetic protein FliR